MAKTSITFLDAANRRSSADVYWVDLTAANFDAQMTLQDDLVTAINDVVLGTKVRDARYAQITEFAAVLPANEAARRQNKWLVSAVDQVTAGDVTFTIPTANLVFCATGSNAMDTASAQYTALVNAIQAGVRSKYGNPITVTNIEFVGRSI